jgi:uncharacterized protein YcbX
VRVVALHRYPVKSMQGEALTEAHVGAHGITGDRRFGILDLGTGLVLTARRVPALLDATAVYDEAADRVRITDVAGAVLDGDEALSAWLGRPVRLVRAAPGVHATYETVVDPEHEDTSPWVRWDGPAGSFHDSGRTQVSIVGEGTLGAWHPRRFRANVVITGDDEDALVGRSVALGSAAVEVVKRIERCVVTTRAQPGGIERDLDVLRTVQRERQGCLGVGAVVTVPGAVRVGDPVSVRSGGPAS